MSPVNLSPARLAVLVALVVGGIAVLLNGFDSTGGTAVAGGASPSPTVAVSPSTSSPTTTAEASATPKPQKKGVSIMVLNGTTTTGLGATVQQMLEDHGYVAAAEAGNAPIVPTSRTVVYFRTGADSDQAKADATFMATEYLHDADVKPLNADFADVVPADAELAVVVGDDYPGATD
jgi:LytR cell envelope-related transcriptional attenuator